MLPACDFKISIVSLIKVTVHKMPSPEIAVPLAGIEKRTE
jgi:hypothetical protein